jgi:hypothetical protein
VNKTAKFLFLFSLIAYIVSCDKREITLPKKPETIDGTRIKAGVMAKVNDLDFISVVNSADTVNLIDSNAVDANQSPYYYSSFVEDSSTVVILAIGEMPAQDSVKYARISLWITRFNGAGTYSMNDGSSFAYFDIVDSKDNSSRFSSSDIPNNGNVKISSFDTAAHTISGTFEFSAISNDSLLVVKNGVFNSVYLQ